MKISTAEFTRLMDGIACAVTSICYAFTEEEPDVKWVEDTTRRIACEYLESIGIDDVEDDEDEDEEYFPDDVDETNYDPYCGCDMFEICGSIDEEW